MPAPTLPSAAPALFSHVMADNAPLYRVILDAFSAAKRQFRLHLRPDDLLAQGRWPKGPPSLETLQQLLGQLVEWGNLQSQPDTARVATIEDFYRKRLLYRMTSGGEAVEAGLQAFADALARRAELQSVALDDIRARLISLRQIMRETPPDAAKAHGALRDLVHVFEGLADNAEAFMAGLTRTLELQRAEVDAVMSFKTRLIDYLQRFIGDLVTRSSQIAELLAELRPLESALLQLAAERDAQNAAPGGDAGTNVAAVDERLEVWRERWAGLTRWFVAHGRDRAQAELLRASALSAIPRLLQAVSLLHERRAGRSDRAADFRRLALWFAGAHDDADAHRLWRAAFALSPARHLALAVEGKVGANTAWRDAPGIPILPKLREQGLLPTRGAPPRIRDRTLERGLLAERVAQESAQTEAARQRLATDRDTRLSELGQLDAGSFRLFLTLLGEALAAQRHPDAAVERMTGDGTLAVRLVPLAAHTRAEIVTDHGTFSGRDHLLRIRRI